MRVTVRTIARLGGHLPRTDSAGGPGTQVELEVPPDTTPSEIIANQMLFLGGKGDGGGSSSGPEVVYDGPEQAQKSGPDEDIPF